MRPPWRVVVAFAILPHWLRYEDKQSLLASSSGDWEVKQPTNAILKYVYGLPETEANQRLPGDRA